MSRPADLIDFKVVSNKPTPGPSCDLDEDGDPVRRDRRGATWPEQEEFNRQGGGQRRPRDLDDEPVKR